MADDNRVKTPTAERDGQAIQTPRLGTLFAIAPGVAASAAVSLNGKQLIRTYCDQDYFIRFGDNTIVATANMGESYFIPAGVEVSLAIPESTTHFSVIRSTANGIGQLVALG